MAPYIHNDLLAQGVALWKIDECEEELAEAVGERHYSDSFRCARRRKEWLAGRLLLKRLLARCNPALAYRGVIQNERGAPALRGYGFHVSLSHSFPYVAAQIAPTAPVGIDIQRPHEKLFRVAPRVMQPHELADAGDDLTKLCVYWCAKEAMFKRDGSRLGISSLQAFTLAPFALADRGKLIGCIGLPGALPQCVSLRYLAAPCATLVYSAPEWIEDMPLTRLAIFSQHVSL